EGAVTNEKAREKAEKVLDEGIKSQSNPKNAQFEQGIRLIDQLEKEGTLSTEGAQHARQKLNSAFLDESDILAEDESSLLNAFSQEDNVTYTKKTNDGSELTISKSKPKSDLLEYIKANSTLADLQARPSTAVSASDLVMYGPVPMEWKGITWTPPHFA